MIAPQATKPVLDEGRARLRETLAQMEQQIGGLGDQGNALGASLADLAKQLALGPEPEVRFCPHCNHVGLAIATLCGHCWARITPIAASSPSIHSQGQPSTMP